MKKKLLIVFVKSLQIGKVKTRLAKTIGDLGAFEVYKELVLITDKVTSIIDFDKIIYFSDSIDQTRWITSEKRVQIGIDLGDRMKNAFDDGFKNGYQKIILIGSDLPQISKEIIMKGFDELENSDVVFGPAQDGGYYLIGMNTVYESIFENKPWSQPNLLKTTLAELKQQMTNFSMIETLNDIDTFEDLIASNFYKNNSTIQQIINQIHE